MILNKQEKQWTAHFNHASYRVEWWSKGLAVGVDIVWAEGISFLFGFFKLEMEWG